MNLIKRPTTRLRHKRAGKFFGLLLFIGLIGVACEGHAQAAEVTPPTAVVDALADPTTFYVVPDVDNDPTAACLLSLDWTGHAGDTMEAIYAPTVVIAACKRAPVGTHPLSTDDVTPAVWRELVAIYGVDLADPTDPIVFSVPGVAHALSVIDDGIGR